MWELVNKHFVKIVLSAAFLVIGVLVGGGTMFFAGGSDREKMVDVLRTTLHLMGNRGADFQIETMSNTDLITLAEHIRTLPPEHDLSRELIKLHARREGPFRVQESDVVVMTAGEELLPAYEAATCGRNGYFGKRFDLYSKTPAIVTKNMLGVLVVHEMNPSLCGGMGGNVIWINRRVATEWLGESTDRLPEQVIVTARQTDIVVGI